MYLPGVKVKPLYISCTYSSYEEEKVVWRSNITQEDALGFCLDRHDGIMEIVQAVVIDNPQNKMIVYPMNISIVYTVIISFLNSCHPKPKIINHSHSNIHYSV